MTKECTEKLKLGKFKVPHIYNHLMKREFISSISFLAVVHGATYPISQSCYFYDVSEQGRILRPEQE